MSKEIILMEDVAGLGLEGDIVKVADGYARNYLLPRNLGAPLTGMAKKQLEQKQAAREARLQSEAEGARKQAALIEQTSCTVTVKTGEEGKLYGSVTTTDIAAALKEQGVEVDKSKLVLGAPIRELGVFKVPVKLHPEIEATLKVWVVEE